MAIPPKLLIKYLVILVFLAFPASLLEWPAFQEAFQAFAEAAFLKEVLEYPSASSSGPQQ